MIKRDFRVVKVFFLMAAGSALGVYFQLPIGAVMGSFLTIAIAQMVGLGAKPLQVRSKRAIQMTIGGIAGLNINSELLNELKAIFIPGLLATLSHFILALIVAYWLQKVLKIDWFTALCGSIPAGMSEISIIAEDVDADVQLVTLMHLFRVSMLVTFLPFIISVLFL